MPITDILSSFDTRPMAVSKLKPYDKNAKKHDAKQIDNVANSIRRFGWQQPIVVDENNVVIIGHCRLLAAKKLGLKQAPVKVATGLTDEEIRELRIIDNKTNESDWDNDLLSAELSELPLEGFDFDFDGILEEDAPETRDVETVAEDDNAIDKLPPSRLYICAVSAFGTDSQCIMQIAIDQDDADRILNHIGNGETKSITQRVRDMIHEL